MELEWSLLKYDKNSLVQLGSSHLCDLSSLGFGGLTSLSVFVSHSDMKCRPLRE